MYERSTNPLRPLGGADLFSQTKDTMNQIQQHMEHAREFQGLMSRLHIENTTFSTVITAKQTGAKLIADLTRESIRKGSDR